MPSCSDTSRRKTMSPSEKSEVAGIISDVLKYYRQPVSEFILGVWMQACEPFEVDQISRALTEHIQDPEHGTFAPKVSDLTRVLQGTSTDRAALAWGKTLEAMSAVGAYTDVVFDDPAIHAVVEDLGGWPKLCRSTYEELSYIQHRFCVSHKAYIGRGTFEYPRMLTGDRAPLEMYERKGLPVPRPAMVGNLAQCQRVLQQGGAAGKTQITFNTPTVAQAIAAATKSLSIEQGATA